MSRGRMVSIRMAAGIAAVLCLSASALARVPYPVAQSYEDTVRIAVLYNHIAPGPQQCLGLGFPGPATEALGFVIRALDTTKVKKVVVHRSPYTVIDTILSCFPGQLPHVIVHINGGWGSYGGANIARYLQWAANSGVGIIEIGDDDMWAFSAIFTPWAHTNSGGYTVMTEATWLNKADDSLWVRLQPGNDNTADSAVYPFLNGIVRNAVKVKGDTTLTFKVFGDSGRGRCEADPDGYTADAGGGQVLELGFQQGYNATLDAGWDPGGAPQGYFGEAGVLNNCVRTIHDSIPDSIGGPGLRRGVSLSLQPQFLADSAAAQQLVYDAIMYASMVHFVNGSVPMVGVRRPAGGVAARAVAAPRMVRVTDLSGRTIFAGPVEQARTLLSRRSGVVVMTTISGVNRPSRMVSGR